MFPDMEGNNGRDYKHRHEQGKSALTKMADGSQDRREGAHTQESANEILLTAQDAMESYCATVDLAARIREAQTRGESWAEPFNEILDDINEQIESQERLAMEAVRCAEAAQNAAGRVSKQGKS